MKHLNCLENCIERLSNICQPGRLSEKGRCADHRFFHVWQPKTFNLQLEFQMLQAKQKKLVFEREFFL